MNINKIKNFGLLVCGGRTFDNYPALAVAIDNVLRKYDIELSSLEIIDGGCIGADKLAELYAKNNGIKNTIFPAKWSKYGKAAGPIRNNEMIRYLKSFDNSAVIGCVSENSRGTKYTMSQAKKEGIDTYEINYSSLDEDVIEEEEKCNEQR